MVVHEDIERELERRAGIYAIAEEVGDEITLSGLIASEDARRAALDIATALSGGKRIVDNLEIVVTIPEGVAGAIARDTPGPDLDGVEPLEPGDFTDQRIAQDPLTAGGPSGTAVDEEVSEGEESYVPPIDPVRDRAGEVLGGFALSAADDADVERSALDGRLGDEAIADAVRRELREDSATTGLEIKVEVRQGVVRLRGSVQDLADADAAEEVAARVPGVREVVEELRVANL
jgi:osmotically-inducible protein OsmY